MGTDELIHWVKTHLLLGDGRTSPKALRTLDLNLEIKERIWSLTSWIDGTNIAARVYCIKHHITEAPTCPGCYKRTRYVNGEYQIYCSTKCTANNTQVIQQRKETMLARYGAENPQQVDSIRDKSLSTMEQKYGSKYALAVPEAQAKRKQTLVDKFGTSNTNLVSEIANKRRATNLERYGDIASSRRNWTDEIRAKVNDPKWLEEEHITKQQSLATIAKSLCISDKILGDYFKKYNIDTRCFQQSTGEREVAVFLESLGLTITRGRRDIIAPLELDIFVPEYNLAVEYCGLYWHSEVHKAAGYHLTKYMMCQAKGIRLLTLYEDEWQNTKDVVKSKIKHILGITQQSRIFARKCKVVKISNAQFADIMNTNHIQGTGPASIKLGLECDGNLVAAMGFIRQPDGIFVLNRYATRSTVVGGFSKLLTHFTKTYAWSQILSFADLRWSQGHMYEANGFTLTGVLSPDYEYVKNNKRHHKFGFRHKHLANKLEHYDSELSEVENCHNHGYVRIFDCGLLRYILKKDEQ